jgi:cytochrome b561
MAGLVLLMLPVGVLLQYAPQGPIQNTLYDLHRSTGVLLLVMAVIRLGYRLGHAPPPLPADIPAVQRHAAGIVHVLLYALLFAMPIVGWWGTSAFGAPITVFWLFELPPLVAKDAALSEQVLALHGWLGLTFAGLVGLHSGAALHHHLVRKDETLRRML